MNIISVERYRFEFSEDEINAIKVLSEIDCSKASVCDGCPLNSAAGCLQIFVKNVAIREGLIEI